MERKIGETFEYEGKTFIVKEDNNYSCHGCVFNKRCTLSVKKMTGECKRAFRKDNKDVVFSEVQEQHTEEPKERKIGEVFQYEGKKLKVEETEGSTCYNCYFKERDCDCENTRKVLGACLSETRTDNKPVIFVEVKEETKEQPQEEQELNLCEILKNCPEGTELWSDNYGEVQFLSIEDTFKPILTRRTDGLTASYTKEGWHRKDFPANCLLWPSRDCRDWSKFTAPRLKKERFDPHTLRPFDKVIARIDSEHSWNIDFFSCFRLKELPFCLSGIKCVVLPYNDETKHLIGTTKEAPDFYRYWE